MNLKHFFRTTILTIFFILLFQFGFKTVISAQTCGGSVTCCIYGTVCTPDPCGGFGQPACNCSTQCVPNTIENGVCTANGTGGCVPACFSKTLVETSCGWINSSCPSGQSFCGGCIGACRNTATKNCTTQIAEECSGQPQPTPGPGCTPACSGNACGQGDGCGGTCGTGDVGQPGRPQYTIVSAGVSGGNYDATEALYFFRTDNVNGRITVEWTLGAGNSDLVEYRFTPSDVLGNNLADSNGASGCNHMYSRCDLVSPSTTSVTFRPRGNRYYRMRIRQRGVCGTWGEWRERVFRIDGQIPGYVMLDANSSATPTGLYGTCTDSTATAILNTTMTVTASGQGYSDNDPSINAASGRYRTFIAYQNVGNPSPGTVSVTLNNIPAGYVVTCPAGGAYTSSNSTIGSPLLTNGQGGENLDANFYLCNAGSTLPTPTNLTPTNNSTVSLTGATTPIGWSPGAGAAASDRYQVQVIPATAVAGVSGDPDNTAHCLAQAGYACPAAQLATTYSFTVSSSIYSYAYRVRSYNPSCAVGGTWTPWIYFNTSANITGNFYLDPAETAVPVGGICALGGATATSPGGGAAVEARAVDANDYTGSIVGSTYTVTVPYWNPGNNIVSFTPGTDAVGQPYICTCPAGCQYSGIDSPQAGVNFFFRENNLVNDGWYQTRGGSAYAEAASGTVLQSYIPTLYCTTAAGCKPYILAQDTANNADSAGIALTGGGTVDSTSENGDSGTNITERGTQVRALGTVNTKIRENYNYFYRQFSLGLTPTDDFASSANDAREPTSAPGGGKQAYFRNGNMVIQQPWTISSAQKITVIVNGDLRLRQGTAATQLITVANGGFLAFIVSGDIIVETTVGNTNDNDTTTPNIEGVFIADGEFITEAVGAAGGGDKPFVGAGTFVGWSGVTLNRNYDDGGLRKAENNDKAIETFIFRPDFVINAPTLMTRSSYIWQETN